MAKLLSNGVPECYKVPVDKRPGSFSPIQCKTLPVIDLKGGDCITSDEHAVIVQQIINAGKEFGFFQIVNHGVPVQVMNDMMNVTEEFFNMPTEEKMPYSSNDPMKLPRFHTGLAYDNKELLYWRDSFKIGCYPLEDFKNQWPEKPPKFGDALEVYGVTVRGVALRLLRLISEGLGIEEGYFDGQLSGGPVVMNLNHYAPCPDPSITLGLPAHCDPGLFTVLQQGDVRGLQVLHDGDWLTVEPIPGAFVVNFGHQLEIITNGILKSVEHRAVTNMTMPRTSLATVIAPAMDCIIAPASALIDEDSPPLYRSFPYLEFFKAYLAESVDRERVLGGFEIKK